MAPCLARASRDLGPRDAGSASDLSGLSPQALGVCGALAHLAFRPQPLCREAEAKGQLLTFELSPRDQSSRGSFSFIFAANIEAGRILTTIQSFIAV